MITLGTDKAWRVRRLSGGLIASYQWLHDEPTLFIYPATRRRGGALAVPLASAWQWADSDGHPDLTHAIPTATDAARAMGLDPTPDTIRAIVDAVIDGLPDLVEMPPAPPSLDPLAGQALGDATIQVDGETIAEQEIRA